MATQQLALSDLPSTTSLLVQKAGEARGIMATPTTSPSSALKAAKQLVGCFPHARPPEPETYAGALGATLAQYPPHVVAECADPRIGLVRKLRFPPTVAEIVEWCDARVEHYRVLAAYEARPKVVERVFTEEDRALARKFLADLAAELGSRGNGAIEAALTPQPLAEAAE